MPPLLKRLLGNGSDDRQVAEDMRAVLNEMRQERQRFETLLESSRGAQEQLSGLSEPIAKAASDMNAATVRLTHMARPLKVMRRADARSHGAARARAAASEFPKPVPSPGARPEPAGPARASR